MALMIINKIIGSLHEEQYKHLKPDYVSFEWYEVFKKVHRKNTKGGQEIGIQMNNDILAKGLNQDDILYISDENNCIAVDILPCEVLKIKAHSNHGHMLVKVAYEIGNRHMTAFWGEDYMEIITPHNSAFVPVLNKIHGIEFTTGIQKLNLNKRISATVSNHTH